MKTPTTTKTNFMVDDFAIRNVRHASQIPAAATQVATVQR